MNKSPKVADFSTHFSGPTASRRLMQLGADILKIEHPKHGDGNRRFPPYFNNEGIHHLYLNAGARSVTIAPGTDEWRHAISAIARWADVVIVGKQPSSAQKLGIDVASLLCHNPELVYCLITGYGVAGEWADLPAHGLNMDALAGTLPLEWKDGNPRIPEHYRSVGTTVAGIEAALGIYAALYRRSRGGGGQVVHVSIWESALATMWRDVATFANTGSEWAAYRDLGPRYDVYAASDAKALLVCPIERHFWERFCDALELPTEVRRRGDWSNGVDTGKDYVELGERQQIANRLRCRKRDDWISILGQAEVPVAPVLDWRDAMASDHANANGTMAEYEYNGNTVRVPTSPASVTSVAELNGGGRAALAESHRKKSEAVARAPYLGEHTEAVFRELGIQA
jgi:crotonobetainyl-CoA:carnitine CoA-transferase CaiB-like acyl-CoA transferase